MSVSRVAERLLLAFGTLALGVYAVARIDRHISSQAALDGFARQRAALAGTAPAASVPLPPGESIDFSKWSPDRVSAYRALLSNYPQPAVAVLRIPKLRLEVPVFDGEDERTLNRGLGRVPGTARPGSPGNLALAGHRDSFFRTLGEVKAGDEVELVTPEATQRYVAEWVRITTPEDFSMLADTAEPTITLITCYPFYFIGSAPKRFIVRFKLHA